MSTATRQGFSWPAIVRLGVVQASIGAIVVLTTSTLNRVMVVELALPAVLPGILVALHYFIQITRPRFGHGSDLGGRRTPWIIGGMCLLAAGGLLAAVATAWMASHTWAGIALATLAFLAIGAGVGASGTSLLVLLASGVRPSRRAAAATVTWLMMIAGFAITAGIVGQLLDPFSYTRLIFLTGLVCAVAVIATILAIAGLEGRLTSADRADRDRRAGARPERGAFMGVLREVLAERHTRRFAAFVFLSMLAYSAQDLVLEPFAGAVFGLTPGQSTQLGGLQHSGVLAGMLLVAMLGYLWRKRDRAITGGDHTRLGMLQGCLLAGCLGSAALLTTLALGGFQDDWPLALNVFTLGLANGAFAVAAIGAMMGLVSRGREQRDGMRMGVFGAAQAIAFGLGGILGTVAVDLVRWATDSVPMAYGVVFMGQALAFACAAWLASGLERQPETNAEADRAWAVNDPDAGSNQTARPLP